MRRRKERGTNKGNGENSSAVELKYVLVAYNINNKGFLGNHETVKT